MMMNKAVFGLCCALLMGLSGCSRRQSDWEKTRAANSTDAYEQFLKNYPSGEFTAQAQARIKELYEDHDWQKARDTDTQEAYQAFLKQHPEGKWTEEARIRVENFTLAQSPSSGTANTPANPAAANPAAGNPAAANPAAPAARRAAAPAASAQPAPKAPASPRAQATTAAPTTAAPTSTGAPTTAAPRAETRGPEHGIQLGAFKSSADAAKKHWAHLEKDYPKLLAGLSPTVAPTQGGSRTLYRLQVVGLSDKRARSLCKALKDRSQACIVIHPGKPEDSPRRRTATPKATD